MIGSFVAERSGTSNLERLLLAYTVEKLCFEMSGAFICDLNDIT